MHRIPRRTFLKAAGAALLAAAPGSARAQQAARPNVLFICVDDLRPQLSCYGKDFMHTPHLDRLAAEGTVFTNHFVQVPTCGASRCSLLTGQRPHAPGRIGNHAFETLPRDVPVDPVSMPHLFRQNGYRTVTIGKVSHSPTGRRCGTPSGRFDEAGNLIYSGVNDNELELPFAWDKAYGPTGEWGNPWSAFFGYAGGKTRSYTAKKSPAVEAADVPDTGYPDGLTAETAIQELRALKDDPFFLAVGFFKPHLPFNAPKKYWDLYNRDEIPLAEHKDPPANVDLGLSLHPNGELVGRYAALSDPADATDEEARRLRHGYFACVSYVDAQIGRVLDELDRLGLRDNTIVVVWGDHGWHLGDLHVWGKHTTYEFSMRSALLMRVPGVTQPGTRAAGLVESLDLYPTLADCCGLEIPEDLDGCSIAPVLRNPSHAGKDGAFGYWVRGSNKAMTLRTARYRVVEWVDREGNVAQVELYDHETDSDETCNVAAEHRELTAALLEQLHRESPRLAG